MDGNRNPLDDCFLFSPDTSAYPLGMVDHWECTELDQYAIDSYPPFLFDIHFIWIDDANVGQRSDE